MTAQGEPRQEKTAAVLFAGFLTLALGGAGLLVAALAVGIERAWNGGAVEADRARERRRGWLDERRAWLDVDHTQRASRAAERRNWLTAGGDPAKEPAAPTWTARFRDGMRRAVAHTAIAVSDFTNGARDGWRAAQQTRRDGGTFRQIASTRPAVEPTCGNCRRHGIPVADGGLCADCLAEYQPTDASSAAPAETASEMCRNCRRPMPVGYSGICTDCEQPTPGSMPLHTDVAAALRVDTPFHTDMVARVQRVDAHTTGRWCGGVNCPACSQAGRLCTSCGAGATRGGLCRECDYYAALNDPTARLAGQPKRETTTEGGPMSVPAEEWARRSAQSEADLNAVIADGDANLAANIQAGEQHNNSAVAAHTENLNLPAPGQQNGAAMSNNEATMTAESNATVLRGLLLGIKSTLGVVSDQTDQLATTRTQLSSEVARAEEFATVTGQSAQARQALDEAKAVSTAMGKHLGDFSQGAVSAEDQMSQASDGLRVAEEAEDSLRSAGADGRAVAPAGAHA